MQNLKMEDQGSTVSFCPSFNTYASDRLSAIAVRVSDEEETQQNASDHTNHNHQGGDVEEEDDFEFVLVRANPDDCSTTGGGDPVMNSYPVFPVFNRDLLLEYENDNESKDHNDDEEGSGIRLPLEKLFIEDRDPLSSSSSEADELEGIKPGTYCVWTPAKSPSTSPSPLRCKKSNSTGSSSSSKQKWRLRDLLHLRRSNSASDGKESLVFFNSDPSKSIISREIKKEKTTAAAAVVKGGKAKEKVSAHEVFYVRNKALKEGDKRRSYLPYRQGLVGFFSNVNGLGRSFPPF